MRCPRSWCCLAVLVTLATGTASAIPKGGRSALVVAFPKEGDARDQGLREHLKAHRTRHGRTVDSMPIVRMYWSVPEHRKILEQDLGLTLGRLPAAGVARRDEVGWPRQWLWVQSFSAASSVELLAAQLVDRFLAEDAPAPAREPPGELGFLLVADFSLPAQKQTVDDFTAELGFLGSSGFPAGGASGFRLTSYDVAQAGPRELCRTVLRIGPDELPWAGVVLFQDHTPRQIVRATPRVDRPLTAARELLRAFRSASEGRFNPPGTSGRP